MDKEKAILMIAVLLLISLFVFVYATSDKSLNYKCYYSFNTPNINGSSSGQKIQVKCADNYGADIDNICNDMAVGHEMNCGLYTQYVQGGWEDGRIEYKDCRCIVGMLR
jgi:hypothetical protein